ncbi:hypothetical protein B0T16DRAFT_420238 [Cercophora newfieldiana]|uniref:Uncharacterized protein n=1 Tax=Cercophora newfieldiana TaxID=92897 RepID=A0AA40CLR2_9PEZI|nr:hypothetical protein B0T16DRAFT_420238 [Cercophora newfieldiana]
MWVKALPARKIRRTPSFLPGGVNALLLPGVGIAGSKSIFVVCKGSWPWLPFLSHQTISLTCGTHGFVRMALS